MVRCYDQRDNDPYGVDDELSRGGVPAAQRKSWFAAMNNAKTSIVLTPDVGPLAETRRTVEDDHRTAIELWNALERWYKTSTEKLISNLKDDLENLKVQANGNWDFHFNKFKIFLGNCCPLIDQ